MANFWSGDNLVVGTNPHPPLICDPTTTTTSHGIEEPFSSYPKIGKVWSINNPTNVLTPQPVVEAGDQSQEEPLPPLRLKVQLPTKQSFLANGVTQLELILLYGDLEEHVLLIDIHGPTMELPIQPPLEIPITDNSSVPINSFPSPPPIVNQGAEESLENDPSPPSNRKIITPRRTLQQSTTCRICHKKFTNKSKAATHSFVHLSQEEKEAVKQGWKNQCYFCAKRFQTPTYLGIHLTVHTKEKPHLCPKCGKQFTQKGYLTKHQRLHDPDPATRRPFHCSKCGKSFTTKQSLTTHVNMVHLRLKEFQCPECNQKFATKGDMTRHLNAVHLGIRYPCRKPHCGKSFTQIGQLRQHEKTAH